MKHIVSVSIIASFVLFLFIVPGCQQKPKEEVKPAEVTEPAKEMGKEVMEEGKEAVEAGKEAVGVAVEEGKEAAGEVMEKGKEMMKETVGETTVAGKEMAQKPGAGETAVEEKEMAEDTRQDIEQGLINRVRESGLNVQDFSVEYREGAATIRGRTPSQEEREKIALLVGNTKGVGQVNDQLTVESSAPEAVMYTVKSGDTLMKIAEEHYGNPGKYTEIFGANQPMLEDPDSIYPGQVLRIPPLEG